MKQAKRTMQEKLDYNKKMYGRNSFFFGVRNGRNDLFGLSEIR